MKKIISSPYQKPLCKQKDCENATKITLLRTLPTQL